MFLVIEVKCLPRANGEEFLKTKRGFCLKYTHIQKPISFFTQVSRIERYGSLFDTYFPEIHHICQESNLLFLVN